MNQHDRRSLGAPYWFGPFCLAVGERVLKRDGEQVRLGSRAMEILIALVERAGEVVTHQELISLAWPHATVEEANLRVHIAALRKSLGDGMAGARFISNVVGRGYCFVAPVSRSVFKVNGGATELNIDGHTAKLPPVPKMIGRAEIVEEVAKQLGSRRFVSIVGPGGVGKTTVALSVAHLSVDRFDGAVFFLDLSSLTDPGLVVTAVSSALGVTAQPHGSCAALFEYLASRRLLLVLDNCEHVIDTTAELAERMVTEAPSVHVLSASREPFRTDREYVYVLTPLECPPDHPGFTVADALRYPATHLFIERAMAAGYCRELSNSDAQTIADICRKLDGIALAIELAASRVVSLGIHGTVDLLDNRFGLIWQGRRSALTRHQTLNSMLDWSCNLLSKTERTVLCRLSVFVGEFTLKAACAVACGPDLDDVTTTAAIASLVTKSLIAAKEGQQAAYFRLLELTRAYAAAKLSETGEFDLVARRHAVASCRHLKRMESRDFEANPQTTEHAPHIGNVRAALNWCFSDRGDAELGIQLTTVAAPLLIELSLLDECRKYCGKALSALGEEARGGKLEAMLQEALALSWMFTVGNNDEVRVALERGFSVAAGLQDAGQQLQLLAGLNIFFTRVGDFRAALESAEKASAISRRADDGAGRVVTDWMLGVSHHLAGNQAAAQSYCEEGMIRAAELGTFNSSYFGYDHRVRALVALARALWLRGYAERAVETAREAIDYAENGSNPVSICISLIYSAPIYAWIGDFGRARDLVNKLTEYASRYGLAPYRAVGVGLRGELAVANGELKEGLEMLRACIKTLQVEQHNILLGSLAGALAAGLLKAGEHKEALLTVNGALSRVGTYGASYYLPELFRLKAEALMNMREADRSAAMLSLETSLRHARQQSALAYELRSATTLARLLRDRGETDQPREVLASLYERFTEGFDTVDLKAAKLLMEQ